jgi:hypothetical protein
VRQQVTGHPELGAKTGQKILLAYVRRVCNQARCRDDLRGQLRVAGDPAGNLIHAHWVGNGFLEKVPVFGTKTGPLHLRYQSRALSGIDSAVGNRRCHPRTISCAVSWL